ncbi:hypothetical protein WBP07_20225 (plasmid) [Novosphingobium sp. BL-8A]|uniref:hypothetical protein n=1 Tax=Novosphingobium sp. BL-8A TaxID=3127639 RepID=UPI003757DC14
MTVSPSPLETPRRDVVPFFGDGSACPHCADAGLYDAALRTHVLHLLSLIESSNALPPEAALRIAGELLLWCEPRDSLHHPHAHGSGPTGTEKAA